MISKISNLIQNCVLKLKTENLKLKTVFFLFFTFYVLCLIAAPSALAGPVSTNFQLLDYGFGAGGTATSSSSNYMMQGILGEVETGSPSSANYISLPGLTYTLEPNTPTAPQLTNPSSFYNKLKIIINNGGNSTDTTFIIAVSTDNFVSDIKYVQTNNTLGTTLVFQTYASWNSGTGFNIIGLTPGTTYYAKVAARRGVYQQGKYSTIASAATINPTFTFNVQTTSQAVPPFTVAIGNLTAGSVTTSSDKVTATISTNATNGGLVYIYGTNNGLKTTTATYTISSSSNNLSSALEGYGARGTTVTQNSGGPMKLDTPYDGAGNVVGVIDTTERLLSDSTQAPITSGQTNFEIKAKASNTTPSASDYTDTITLIGTGSF